MATRYRLVHDTVITSSSEGELMPSEVATLLHHTVLVLAADHERELAEQAAQKDDQWRKTNAEYERVSKENTRLLARLADRDRRIAELVAGLRALYDEQNDAPLDRRRAQWIQAMDQARALLARMEKADS